MATNRSSFEKRERDKAKKARAAAKREKRGTKPGETEGDEDTETVAAPVVDEGQVLAQVAALHQKFDDGDIEFEEFEERRNELMSQLMVD